MKIVLGLGNPGARYRSTRHNVGFMVVDRLARRSGTTFRSDGLLRRYAWWAEAEPPRTSVVLAKPRTYMNRSGRAGAALCRHYAVEPQDMLVIHDDADLELGRLRLRGGGGAGGHKGIRSLIEVLGREDFPRVRLGVRGEGRDEVDLADYVLDPFLPDEVPVAEAMVELAADAVDDLLKDGLETAMNRYNGRRAVAETTENVEEE